MTTTATADSTTTRPRSRDKPVPAPPAALPPIPESTISRLRFFAHTGSASNRRHDVQEDLHQALDELQRLREEVNVRRREEQDARTYSWPPNSPASRLDRATATPEALQTLFSHNPGKLAADIRAVLHTYGLMVQVCKRGESQT